MKVKIIQRSVYHKIAEVEVEIPDDWNKDGNEYIQDYLFDNEHLYIDKIDEAMSQTSFGSGHGMIDGMEDWKEESEWRYEIEDGKDGGHL
jgi:hypothetical protein